MFSKFQSSSQELKLEASRRKLLCGIAVNVLFISSLSRPSEARSLDLGDFLELSKRLTKRTNLRPDIAKQYLTYMKVSTILHLQADELMRENSSSFARKRIISDWYSGLAVTSRGMVCVDYDGALMWEAIGFAKPRGVPNAEAGNWAFAPS